MGLFGKKKEQTKTVAAVPAVRLKKWRRQKLQKQLWA